MKIENLSFRLAVESASGIRQPINTPPPTIKNGDYEKILDFAIKGYTAKSIAETLQLDIIKVSDVMPTAEERQDIRRAREAMKGAEQPKKLVLPEKVGIPLRLYDYLCIKRGVDAGIVNALLDDGSIYEDRRGNVVFVGCDEQNKARFASLRGTHGDYRGDCAGSDKRYGFNMAACAPSDCLYIFESPIDAMSHASLAIAEFGDKTAWEYDRRLSLAGTSDTALPNYLKAHPQIKELVLCLDNDPPGREASAAIARKYAGQGYLTRIELPSGKDYNEDLLQNIERGKAQKITGNLHKETCI